MAIRNIIDGFEKESDAPKNWQSNVIYCRDNSGAIKMIEVQDDIEQNEGDK